MCGRNCRDGCTRRHEGIDIFAPKLRPLHAASDGHVTWLRTDASGTAGNGVGITDARGWRYLYLHVNNDTPGTDDGRNPGAWRFTPVIRMGAKVYSADIAYTYGAPTDQIVVGDWNGDGVDTLGAVRGSLWLLTDRHGGGAATSTFMFGSPGDRAIAGDWNADGLDTAGVRRATSTYLRLAPGGGVAQRRIDIGLATDRPVVAEWRTRDVDDVDSVSLWRRSPP